MDPGVGLALQPDPDRYTLGRLLDDVAERHGDRVALRCQQGAGGAWQSLTYRELREEARRLARGLVGAGVVKGARVALLMPNRPEWAVCAFAVGLVGGVLVPVNTYATRGERDYILRHSDSSLLLIQAGLLERDYLSELAADHPELGEGPAGRLRCPALPNLRSVFCLDRDPPEPGLAAWSALDALAGSVDDALLDALASDVTPSDDGILIYTSGTTAHPKGVLHMQRAAVIQSWRFAESMGLVAEDVVLTAQPFFWTAGIAMSLGSALAAGATLIVEPVFEPGRFLELIEQERVTTLHAWPHQEKALAEHEAARTRDLTSLEKIEFASPLAALAGLEKDVWGTYGSYGLSETFTLASSLPASAPAGERSGTSGRPLPGMTLRIVDPETGEPIGGPGAKGEIAVKGVTFMRGYHKVAPELYLDEDGFFRTQDGGSFDGEGFLHWSGRLSNLIKTGGANVSPLEIDQTAAEREEVHLACAVGVPHPVLGEVIVLCVVPAAGATVDEQTLRGFLRERLAAYKVPKRVLVFAQDELEFTANQKVQVGPLRDLALARLREEGAEIEGVTYANEAAG